jgi:hypothetical protein
MVVATRGQPPEVCQVRGDFLGESNFQDISLVILKMHAF